MVASDSTRLRQNLEHNESENTDDGTQDNVYYEQNYDNPPEKLVHLFHEEKNKNEASNEEALNAKDYIFFETISKNSGIIENE